MGNFKKLNQKLAELYPKENDARRILEYAEIATDNIDFSGGAKSMWFSIIKEAQEQKYKMSLLLQEAIEEYPEDDVLLSAIKEQVEKAPMKERENATSRLNEAYQFDRSDLDLLVASGKIKDVLSKLNLIADSLSQDYKNDILLLQGRYSRLENENAQGILTRQEYNIEKNRIGVAISHNIDQISSEQEIKDILSKIRPVALAGPAPVLDIDSGALEKVLGKRDDIVEIDWLTKALKASESVCKIQLNDGSAGTGWILEGKYIMTNHHVLADEKAAGNARAIFNFQVNNQGEEQIYELDPSAVFITDQTLDYTLVSVKDDGTLSNYGTLELETFEEPQEGHLVNIIQHPKGKSKKIAMPDEIISFWKEKNYLFYLADTEPGSSGSPVFNQNWKVVALHHAGLNESEGGMIINEFEEKKPANRGIWVKAIVTDIKQQSAKLGTKVI